MRRGLVVALVGAAICVAGISWGYRLIATPMASPGQGTARSIEIPEGVTFRQVAGLLEMERLIRSRWAFVLLGKVTLSDRRILAGEYILRSDMPPGDILAELRSGKVALHQVTIPEGYTAVQISELLSQKGILDGAEFLKLVHDQTFIRSLDLSESSLEGYLFPSTYRIARHAKPRDVIGTMVAGLRQVLTPELQARAKEVNMTIHQVLTLASVIEKESSVEDERELVSAVFHNRLRKKIPLQSDPTVIYGLQNFDGNLRKKDLSFASPYNTYKVAGLPPGPIANPGAGAIRAALYPVPTNYLYFVSRNDGTHQFSATLAEHNRAVELYQRRHPRRASKVIS